MIFLSIAIALDWPIENHNPIFFQEYLSNFSERVTDFVILALVASHLCYLALWCLLERFSVSKFATVEVFCILTFASLTYFSQPHCCDLLTLISTIFGRFQWNFATTSQHYSQFNDLYWNPKSDNRFRIYTDIIWNHPGRFLIPWNQFLGHQLGTKIWSSIVCVMGHINLQNFTTEVWYNVY